MKKVTNFMKTLWNDESGQGTAEYVLLLAVVVGIIVLFKDKIRSKLDGIIGNVSDQMDGVVGQ